VKDATVTVEYADLHVGVLGEVKSTGIVPIDRDQFTILDAIERAGDLTQYGNRKNVKVFRKNGNAVETYEVDLTKFKEVCASPVYLLQQDDVIYVEANKVRARQSTASGNTLLTPSFWMSVLSVGISIAVLLKK
jgi:polysaccharide export outer membrane protein